MKNVIPVSFLTYREGLKHKVVLLTTICALSLMTGSVLISGFFMRDISKIILDFCLSITNIGGLLIPFFLAITLLAGDIEKRTIVTILARNISRTEYLFGKYLGISMLTATVMLIFLAATLLAILGGNFLYSNIYFKGFSISAVVQSVILSYLGISILNAAVVLWCSITTTSFLATLLTIATYLTGQSIDNIVRFVESPPAGIEISTSISKTVQIIQYIFPNLAAFDHKLSAAHGALIPFSEFAMLSCYAFVYIIATLTLSTILFIRRDL
ncbi:ABC transporter permease subunit [Desulfopila aestuarii]|uniref:ABC-2 family transporter protein n=1 Tax=Desulfopila aestuarii DSM 18488 TaxID=1121416 RepID=A0A1M7Y250_9BACT|nr:ABC transporter permease subunit [Desulfopila aestuarii]SHO45736.1 ABC-2 family transporter protein [Desulfopila aestuarii DSM 18488]